MAETELYSIEAVIEALMRTSAACAHAADDHAVIRGTLLPLMELMQAKCGVFYPAPNAVLDISAPIRIHSAATGEPHMPPQLPAELGEFIYESLQQVATSQDPAFTNQHLKKLPVATAASSSIWSGVTAGEVRFGILALFDPATRSFGPVEQKLVRTFSLQMGHGLASSRSRKQASAPVVTPAPGFQARETEAGVVDRYLEFSRIMNGISRELINPLTAVLGYIELLKGENPSERSLHYLQKLQEQTEKTQAVVASLNAAPQAGSWKPSSPGFAVTNAPALVPKPIVVPSPSPEMHSCVLLIQKSEAVMEFQKSVLSTAGADAICTHAGWEAISILQNNKIDAVILDDELDGEFNASKIFAWICEHKPELAQRVLLTVSPKPADDVREWMEGCGIPSVTKPLHIVKLIDGIQRILGMAAPLPPSNSKFLH
ncbi:MAG TPA: histidine kinase dimerization/phospho-acceptor domain-containing protein [Terriglobales bacterium]|nr:histidine kinase dimerization/phospho-acceptor domain-containing protein [Terriglobales bacterium]